MVHMEDFWKDIIERKSSDDKVVSREKEFRIKPIGKKIIMSYDSSTDTVYFKVKKLNNN